MCCKSKVVPGNNTYAGTLRDGKKILMIGDSHIRRVKRDKLQNSFDNAKTFVTYFSGAKTEDLHHYIISSLLKEILKAMFCGNIFVKTVSI